MVVRLVEVVLFILLSIIECLAVFFLMFTIFRIRFLTYFDYIMYTSTIVSITMYVVWTHLSMSSYAAIITLAIYFLSLIFLFKFRIFYSLIMTVVGYAVYMTIQTIVLFGAQAVKLFSVEDVQTNIWIGMILQLSSIVLSMLLSVLLSRKILWVTFFSENARRIKWTFINILLIVASVFSIILIGIVFSLSDVIVGIVLFLIVTVVLTIILIRKEMTY